MTEKELKFIKQWKSDVVEGFCKYDASSIEELVGNVRNKAIDEFAEKLSQEFIRTDEDGNLYIFAWITDFREIAEQMKKER